MAKEAIKNNFRKLISPLVKIFIKLSPNVLTFIGFIFTCIAGVFFYFGKFWLAGIILIIGSLFDVIDGEVARATNRVSKFGAFLDSCLDRYSDFILLFGIFLFYIKDLLALHTDPGLLLFYIIEKYIAVIITIICIFGCFIVSYTRARAESLGVDCKVGFAERSFRIPWLILGSFFGYNTFVYFLLVLAIITNITGIHRILYVYKKM